MNREQFYRYQEEIFDAFCKRVIRNSAIDEKRKAEARERRECSFLDCSECELAVLPMEDHQDSYHYDFVSYGMIVSVQDRTIASALRFIPPNLRDVLLLYHFCDFTMAEIAEATGLPLSTVDYRLKKAQKRLRKTLEAANEKR